MDRRAGAVPLLLLAALGSAAMPGASGAEPGQAKYSETFSTPLWLADGKRVAFVRRRVKETIQYLLLDVRRVREQRVELLVVDVDAGEQSRLRRWEQSVQVELAASPTERRLAWAEPGGLFLYDAAAKQEARIAENATGIGFTPDGKALVFRAAGADGRAVRLHQVVSGRQLTLATSTERSEWFPLGDGSIVVVGPAVAQVFGSDGVRRRVLWWAELEAARRWRDSRRTSRYGLSLSPDGSRGVGFYGHSLYVRDAQSVRKVATFDERVEFRDRSKQAEKEFLKLSTSPEALFADPPKGDAARAVAVDALRLAGPKGLAAAMAAFDSSNTDAQWLAGQALAQLVGPQDTALIETAMLHPSKRARQGFLYPLLRRDPAVYREALNRALARPFPRRDDAQDAKRTAQRAVIEALPDNGAALLAPETLRAALTNPRSYVGTWAIRAMATTGDPRFRPDLRAILRDGPDHLRKGAAFALLRLGSRDGLPLLEAQLEEPRRADTVLYYVSTAMQHRPEPTWMCPLLLRFLRNAASRQFPASAQIAGACHALFCLTGRFVGPPPEKWMADPSKPILPPRAEDLAAWRRGWEASRSKRPAEWLVAALLSPGPHPQGFESHLVTTLRRMAAPQDAPLLKQLAAHKHSTVRAFALRSLEYFEAGGIPPHARRPQAAPEPADKTLAPLLAALRSRDPAVRENAARALAARRDPAALAALLEAARDDDLFVRQGAVLALLRMGRSAVEPLVAPLRAGRSPDAQVAPADKARATRVIATLAVGLQSQEWQVRDAAAWALAQTRSPEAIEPLIAAMGDADERVRRTAVLGVSWTKDGRVVQPLIAKLEDPSREVRYRAAVRLIRLNDPIAVLPFIELLQSKDWRDRNIAASALGSLKDRVATKPLIAALEEPNRSVRDTVARALAELADPRSLDALLGALDDKSWYVRMSAAEGLGAIGDARALGPLVGLLEDGNGSVRSGAASALGNLGDPRAIEPLVRTLRADKEAQWNAAQALARMKDRRAIEPLIEALADKDSSVRSRAAWALAKITGQKLGPDPSKWHQWWQAEKQRKP